MDKPDPIATVREAQAMLIEAGFYSRRRMAADLDAVVAELEGMHSMLTPAAESVLNERRRQIEAEGWSPEHDDEHKNGEMAFAAACYAAQAASRAWLLDHYPDGAERYASDSGNLPDDWPDSWAVSWWKPKNPRRDLVRAAALILAEIERLDRADAARAKEAGDA